MVELIAEVEQGARSKHAFADDCSQSMPLCPSYHPSRQAAIPAQVDQLYDRLEWLGRSLSRSSEMVGGLWASLVESCRLGFGDLQAVARRLQDLEGVSEPSGCIYLQESARLQFWSSCWARRRLACQLETKLIALPLSQVLFSMKICNHTYWGLCGTCRRLC